MLESNSIWIGLMEAGAEGERRRGIVGFRGVFDSADGTVIGRIVERSLRWLPWQVRWQFAAQEGQDGSVVCVGRRAGWLPRDWDVIDADGNRVAFLRSIYVVAPDGRVVGRRTQTGVIAADGAALGSWRREGVGIHIEFDERTLGEPFLRMTILIAALIEN